VRERASHAATLRVQCRKILEWICVLWRGIGFRKLRLHAALLRVQLKAAWSTTERHKK
jgi:hypothetical protein